MIRDHEAEIKPSSLLFLQVNATLLMTRSNNTNLFSHNLVMAEFLASSLVVVVEGQG